MQEHVYRTLVFKGQYIKAQLEMVMCELASDSDHEYTIWPECICWSSFSQGHIPSLKHCSRSLNTLLESLLLFIEPCTSSPSNNWSLCGLGEALQKTLLEVLLWDVRKQELQEQFQNAVDQVSARTQITMVLVLLGNRQNHQNHIVIYIIIV